MINLNNYKAVIFDWDGTLVDSHDMLLNAHNNVRIEFEEPLWSMEEFMSKPSLSGREFFGMVYPDRAKEADEIFYAFIEKHHLEFLNPMEQAKDLLDHLDLPLGIVSNKRHPTLQLEVDHMTWRPHFETIIGAGKAERDKPAPDPLLMAMGEIDRALQGQDILYVGDTETDLKTAKAVGCDVVFVQTERPRPDLIAQYKPAYHYHDIKEFLQAVTNISGLTNKLAC